MLEDEEYRALLNHIETARFFLAGKQWNRAVEAARKVLVIEPRHAEAHAILAICAARCGDNDQARREADIALELGPGNKYNFYASTVAALVSGDFQRAEADARAGLALDPYCDFLHFELSRAFSFQKRWAEARECLTTALELAPEKAIYHLSLASAHHALGDYEKCDLEIQDTLRLDPENAEAQKYLGLRQIDTRQFEAGTNTLRTSLRLNPQDIYTQKILRYTEVSRHCFFWFYKEFAKIQNLRLMPVLLFCTGFEGVDADIRRVIPSQSHLGDQFSYIVFCLGNFLALYLFLCAEILSHYAARKKPAAPRRWGMGIAFLFFASLHWWHWI